MLHIVVSQKFNLLSVIFMISLFFKITYCYKNSDYFLTLSYCSRHSTPVNPSSLACTRILFLVPIFLVPILQALPVQGFHSVTLWLHFQILHLILGSDPLGSAYTRIFTLELYSSGPTCTRIFSSRP
ncbi:hypothetical protein F5879DRAFT_70753 [Lentinula edodes]|nr:hypothetical protein F5879DRAFT_70753 [Lentinula edodes]